MKIIGDLNGIKMKGINEIIDSSQNDGVTISLEYEEGLLINPPFWSVDQGILDLFHPSSKMFLLRLYGNRANDEIDESKIRFIRSIMPLLKKYPNFVLEHFSVNGLKNIQSSLLRMSKQYPIGIAANIHNYDCNAEGYVESMGLDYEIHSHIYDDTIIDRIKKGKKIILDRQGCYSDEIPSLLYETQCSDNLHIVTRNPELIKRMANNCPVKK